MPRAPLLTPTADPSPLHLVVPFASCSADACRAMLPTLLLPRLGRLLGQLSLAETEAGDEFTAAPPHERVLARAQGLPVAGGATPWAAAHAHALGLSDAGDGAWAFLTLCHWQVGTDHIVMGDPAALQLDAAATDALRAVVAPYFAEDGIALYADLAGRWLARGAAFDGLMAASLDRVLGRNLDVWMPDARAARTVRRLQSEMQMLLYTHPLNDAREARGALPVNSFWVHGAGTLAAAPQPPAGELQAVDALREPALREDWPAWTAAWQAVDQGPVAHALAALRAGRPVRLSLCGEAGAQTFGMPPESTGLARMSRRITNTLRPQRPSTVLEQL